MFDVTYSEECVTSLNFRWISGKISSRPSQKIPSFIRLLKASLHRYFNGKPEDFGAIPLAVSQAPVFFSRVWKILRRVRPGETISYEALAQRSGSPKAARAVGNAMNKNPFPILIPCHRVVSKRESLGGYSKSLTFKKMLLELENVQAESLVDKRP